MALSFPYTIAAFCDDLNTNKVRQYLQRYDESSGGGDGRIWTAEMAPPLWVAELRLADRDAALAQVLEAKIDGLDGSRGTFLFADPTYPGPASGMTAGLGDVTVASIRAADRGAISLTGLPVGFVLSARDRFTITHTSGRVYLGRFLEGGTAGAAGGVGLKEIRPYLPFGVTAGARLELVRPYFKAFIPPGGYTPFDYDLPHGEIARGGTMRIQQRH